MMMTCAVCGHTNRPNAHFCASCRAPLVLQQRYRVIRLLGRGGYSAVYQVEQLDLGSQHALKEISPDTQETTGEQQAAEEQFKLEARLLAELDHPALPQVTDFFVERKRLYLVMELIEGETLEERLQHVGQPLNEPEVVMWVHTLCDILTFLHTQQPQPIIHRDLKPSNIKITRRNEIKLIDFGIAKRAGAKTQGAARAVSPPYSPLEQYGTGTDARSDIYALGVTAYQLVTNCLPPEAPNRMTEPVIPPRQINPRVSEWFEAAILKALTLEPGDRFPTAAEFKAALAAPVSLQTLAQPVSIIGASAAMPTIPLPANPAPPIAQPQSALRPSMFIALGVFALLSLIVLILLLTSQAPGILRPFIQSPTALALVKATPSRINTSTPSPTSTPRPRPTASPTFHTQVVPPTAIHVDTATPTAPTGIVIQDWQIQMATGQIFTNGANIPGRVRFAFQFSLTNGTDSDFALDQLVIQVRARGANYTWNLNPLSMDSIGLGQSFFVQTETLDLGPGSFDAFLLYKGEVLTDATGNPFNFFFQVVK